MDSSWGIISFYIPDITKNGITSALHLPLNYRNKEKTIMSVRNPRTINNCVVEISDAFSGLSDHQTRKTIEPIIEALSIAYKEIESLKSQLNQLQQPKAD